MSLNNRLLTNNFGFPFFPDLLEPSPTTPRPTTPTSTGFNYEIMDITPVKVQTNTGGVNVNTGQTTFDKILATITSLVALKQGAGYVPTTVHPVNNQIQSGNAQTDAALMAYLQQQQLASAGGRFGDSIQRFLSENTGLLLIGGLGVVLFMSGRK